MTKKIPDWLRLGGEQTFQNHYPEWRKRTLDVLLCLLSLPVTLPVVLVCALLVKLTSKGPVLFKQNRTGRDGKTFQILKLRTMVKDAHALKASLRSDIAQGPDFKLLDDPRVTPIGRILRRSSLDELPQLWNVFVGDMSWVGPRPTSFSPDTYDLWHTERLEVTPGLTGLWQVEQRGDVNFDERVRLDVDYLRNQSLLLDLWIIWRTIFAVAKGRGAY